MKLTKLWTPEIFMECYCVVRNKPIRREIIKPQTATVISLWFWGLLVCPELIVIIGWYTINIPEIFQVFTVSEFDSNANHLYLLWAMTYLGQPKSNKNPFQATTFKVEENSRNFQGLAWKFKDFSQKNGIKTVQALSWAAVVKSAAT